MVIGSQTVVQLCRRIQADQHVSLIVQSGTYHCEHQHLKRGQNFGSAGNGAKVFCYRQLKL